MEPLIEHRLALAGFDTRARELEGEGPPLVLLHGFADSADTWRRVLDRLARESRRALALDLPGFGTASALGDGPVLPQWDAFAATQPTMGPLSLLPRAIRTNLLETTEIFFYGLAGLDNILLGQKVPHPKLEREPSNVWRARRQTAMEFARRAVPQADALRAVRERPEWLRQLVDHPSSWVNKVAIYL